MRINQWRAGLSGLLLCLICVLPVRGASVGSDRSLQSTKADSKPKVQQPAFLEGQRIQAMIDHAHDGAVLRIPPGVYVMDGPLKMEKKTGLTLLCEGVHLQTRDLMDAVFMIKDSAQINIVDGHFQHLKPNEEYQCDGPVFAITNTKEIRIMGTEINGCGAIGVSASRTRNLLVFQCHLHHNTFAAIHLSACRDADIFNCLFESNGQTYNASGSGHVRMQGNQVIQTDKGYWGIDEHQQRYSQFREQLKEPPLKPEDK